MEAPRLRSYCAGMPHLAYAGLSENWLWKECGDLHWERLAQAHGMSRPDFRDASGNKAYAAFTAVRLVASELDGIAENDVFQLHGELAPAGRAQFCSQQALYRAGEATPSARLRMLSAFVFRQSLRDNRSVGRASVESAASLPTAAGAPSPDTAARLVADTRERRQQAAALRDRPAVAVPTGQGEYLGSPCPGNDFNGANFMYFASFPAWVDRAEWHFFRPAKLLVTIAREVDYFGNVNIGEDVMVRCLHWENTADGGLVHHMALYRVTDGHPIAEVRTRKRRARLGRE
ncbi:MULTISPECIES: Pnap_2097 family protein [unclassified Achromobacter]|uniref:Pnap_2097 family protein n=1 Tax=unclassified Achromobacter TaxID=2626865 RepID=UPI00130368A6|nr:MULTISPECIES: Pnap_2097 family protein [unclassified Achromobacter]